MKKTNITRLIALLLCVVMMFGLVACGTPKDAEEAPAEKSPSAETPSTEPAAKEEAGEVKYKEKIVIANNGVYNNHDPQAGNYLVNMYVNVMTHNNLVDYDEANAKVIGDLATSFDLIDDRTYEFKLKDNAVFGNGEPLTANDVKFTLERAAESAGQASKVECIENIEVVDDTTIRVQLVEPNTGFLVNMTEPSMCILNEKAVTEDEEEGCSIGTGPYEITEWVPDSHVLLTAKENYWGEAPKTKQFEFRKIAEDSSRVIGLQAGDLDVILSVPTSEASYIDEDPNCSLIQTVSSQLFFIALNRNHEAFSDVRVRQAVQYAIKQEDIIIASTDGMGGACASTVAPSCWGFSDKVQGYEYNPEKAKELLAEAGYPDGLTIRFIVDKAVFPTQVEIVQAQLAEVGITLDILSTDKTVTDEIRNSGEYDMTLARWAFGAAIDAGLRAVWWTGSQSNYQQISDAKLEELINKAAATIDDDARLALYEEIQMYQMDELATMVPLYVAPLLVGTNNGIQDAIIRSDLRHDFANTYIVEE